MTHPTHPGLGWQPGSGFPTGLAANDALAFREGALEAPGAPATGMRRGLWIASGFACLVIGTIGIVVPLLPTVDFYAMAAICFGRADGRLERWLLAHPRIGPLVRNWRAGRGMPRRAKWIASVSLAAGAAWGAHVLPAAVAWIPLVVCGLVAAWIWTRPSS